MGILFQFEKMTNAVSYLELEGLDLNVVTLTAGLEEAVVNYKFLLPRQSKFIRTVVPPSHNRASQSRIQVRKTSADF